MSHFNLAKRTACVPGVAKHQQTFEGVTTFINLRFREENEPVPPPANGYENVVNRPFLSGTMT